MKLKPMIGKTFNRLTVEDRDGSSSAGNAKWKCVCECGNTTTVVGQDLRSGRIRSCGCLAIETSTTHGLSSHPLAKTYHEMLYRCRTPSSHVYKHYGGRGIAVCQRWLGGDGLRNFIEDMSPRPHGMTLERVDNDHGYGPDNCVWATSVEQSLNRRTSRIITHDGRSMNLSEWAKESGMKTGVLWARLKREWPFSKAISTPVRQLQ